MAVVNLPPGEAMAMAREADLQRRLSSIDPVERFRAHEQLETMRMGEISRIATAQIKRTEELYRAELRRCEESDAATLRKFRQLPPGARTIK